MAQWLKYLLRNCEALSSYLQQKKPEVSRGSLVSQLS